MFDNRKQFHVLDTFASIQELKRIVKIHMYSVEITMFPASLMKLHNTDM